MTPIPTAPADGQHDQACRQACVARQRASVVDVFSRGIGRRRPTGIGGVPVHTGFEGLDTLQEGEELLLHARWGLLPTCSRDAKSLRQDNWMKPKRVAHDAVSSCIVSLSLSQKGWRISPKNLGERPE